MSKYANGADKRHDSTELEQRDVRALTEYMTALPLGGGIYSVTTQSGSEYRVDAREGRCTCPDYEHNLPDGDREVCKHVARVRYATGEEPIPAWINPDAVDSQLGLHVDGSPRVAATDGGALEAEEADGDGDECDCAALPEGVPCWPCYRDGKATFEE
jgi:predicted nucleic acid-binding Zn finger protein